MWCFGFLCARPQPNRLFGVVCDVGWLFFPGTIGGLLYLGRDLSLLKSAIAALPASYTNRGLNLPGPALAAIRGTGIGFYAFLYRYMFGDDTSVSVGRMEHLRTELPELLAGVGEPVSDALRAHVASAAPSNTSAHGAIVDYYDPDLLALVAERDAPLIERFGYRPDG